METTTNTNTETDLNVNTEVTNPTDVEVKPKKKYERRLVEFPLDREFSALSLAAELEVPVHSVNNAIKRMKDKVQVVRKEVNGRGRAKRVYKLV